MKLYYILLSASLLFTACNSSNKQEATVDTTTQEGINNNQEEQKEEMENQPERIVKISTPKGDMLVKLYNETPKHRDNFIKLVEEGYFDDLIFHRVMSEFMIQGGDPDSKNATAGQALGRGGPGYTVPAEFNKNLIHKKGALAAARQPDQVNPTKASSGSQFYIVQGKPTTEQELMMMSRQAGVSYTDEQKEIYSTIGGTPFLDQNYTVFGEVIDGMQVIDEIAAVQTDPRDRPLEDIKMSMKVEE